MGNRKNIISPLMKINNSGEEKMSKKIMTLLIAVAAIGMFAAEPQNLLVFGNWGGNHVWVHSPDKEGQAVRPKILKFTKFEAAEKDGKAVLTTEIGPEVAEIAGKYAPSISASWMQNVKFADTKGGKYKLTFTYTSIPGNTGKNQAYFLAFPKTGKKTGKIFAKVLNVNAKDTVASYEISIPEGADSVDLYLRLNAPGKITFVNPVLTKIAAGK